LSSVFFEVIFIFILFWGHLPGSITKCPCIKTVRGGEVGRDDPGYFFFGNNAIFTFCTFLNDLDHFISNHFSAAIIFTFLLVYSWLIWNYRYHFGLFHWNWELWMWSRENSLREFYIGIAEEEFSTLSSPSIYCFIILL
jgi:hypothetical protein